MSDGCTSCFCAQSLNAMKSTSIKCSKLAVAEFQFQGLGVFVECVFRLWLSGLLGLCLKIV